MFLVPIDKVTSMSLPFNPALREQLANAMKSGAVKPKTAALVAAPVQKQAAKTALVPPAKKPQMSAQQRLDTAVAVAGRIKPVNGAVLSDEVAARLEKIRSLVHVFGVPQKDRTRAMLEVQRSAENCKNYVATIAHGIEDNDIDAATLVTVVPKLVAYIELIREAVQAVEQERKQPKADETTERKTDGLSEETILHYRSYEGKLRHAVRQAQGQDLQGTLTVYVRLPVLTETDPVFSANALQQASIDAKYYDGRYVVLENQMIVGVPISDENRSEAVAKAIRSVRTKFKDASFDLVTTIGIPGPAKSGRIFYWLANRSLLTAMVNKQVSIATWTFPF